MQLIKITIDLRNAEPLTVERWPVIRESEKCVTVKKVVRVKWSHERTVGERQEPRSILGTVNVARSCVSATSYILAGEDDREAVTLKALGMLDILNAELRRMASAAEQVEAEL